MLARLALRLAAIEALCPAALAAAGPWPTIAGPRVYDSRLDPIETDDDIHALEGKPLLIVYTEEQESRPYGQAKQPADDQWVHLVVEIMIATAGVLVIDQPDGTKATIGAVVAPISDRQHEAMVDALEASVRRLLDTRNQAPSSALLALVAMGGAEAIDSLPQRDGSRPERLAARTLRFKIKIRADRWPPLAPPPGAPCAAPASPFSGLPSPLREVAEAMPPASSAYALCLTLVPATPQPPQPPPALAVTITTPLAPLGSVDPAAVLTSSL